MDEDPKNEADNTHRKRKKRLYNTIRYQMEFYFSDSNLDKDRYLSELIKISEDGFIDIDEFLKFNKIRSLTVKKKEIISAVSTSEILQLNEDKSKIRRVTPIQKRENVDVCTVFVENFPSTTDIAWLKSYFSSFGEVTYVSLPKFKSTGQIKGFAFVEFLTPDAAKRACEQFSMKKGENESKLYKQPPIKSMKIDENQFHHTKNEQTEDYSSQNEMQQEGILNDKKKRKRKRRKKTKDKDDISQNLHVIPKAEWNQLRNKYLSLQKANMTQIKKSLGLLKTKENSEKEIIDTKKSSTINFKTGLIVKVPLTKEITNQKQFKEEIKSVADIAYFEIESSREFAYIRTNSEEDSKKLLESEIVLHYGRGELLSGDEENSYWKKIEIDRQEKRNTKSQPKQRGREKIIGKAGTLLNTPKHFFFDD